MRLVFQMLPRLLGLACAGLGVVVVIDLVAGAILSWLDRLDDLVMVVVVAMTVTHAMFMIAASRMVMRSTATVPPLARTGWLVGGAVVAGVIGICAFAATRLLPPYAPIGFTTLSAAILAWTPILPAITARPVLRITLPRMAKAVLMSLAPLTVTAMLGWPAQVCVDECWGLLEGGLIMVPLIGAHLFVGATTAAVVSTLAYAETVPPPPQKA